MEFIIFLIFPLLFLSLPGRETLFSEFSYFKVPYFLPGSIVMLSILELYLVPGLQSLSNHPLLSALFEIIPFPFFSYFLYPPMHKY